MEAVGQLASGIAHDFRNLLTIISGNLEMLALDRSKNRREERVLVAEAWRVTDLMAELTTNLLAFARQGQIDCIPTDIGELATTTARFLSRILGERIGLKIQAVTGLNAKINAAQFQTVLINLAANARDAMPEGGRVAIQVDDAFVGAEEARKMRVTSGRYATVSVRDNGRGMRRETLGRAFELFYTTKPAGNGLGLVAVREFAANVGGTTRIRSKLGEGTSVELWIPVEDGSSETAGTRLPRYALAAPACKHAPSRDYHGFHCNMTYGRSVGTINSGSTEICGAQAGPYHTPITICQILSLADANFRNIGRLRFIGPVVSMACVFTLALLPDL